MSEETKQQKPSFTDILMQTAENEEVVSSFGLFAIWPTPRQTPYKDSQEDCAPLDIFRVKSSTICSMEKTGTLRYDRTNMPGNSALLKGDIIIHVTSGIFCLVLKTIGRDRVMVMSMFPPWDEEDLLKWKHSEQGIGDWVCMAQSFFKGDTLPRWFRSIPGMVDAENYEARMDLMPETRKHNRAGWVAEGRMRPKPFTKEDARKRDDFINALHNEDLSFTDLEAQDPLEDGEFRQTFIPTDPKAIKYMRALERVKKEQKKWERRKQRKEGINKPDTPYIWVKPFKNRNL